MIIRNRIASSLTQASTATLKQQVLYRQRRRARGVPKPSTIAIYASVFALIIAVVAVGYRPPQQSSTIANAAATDGTDQSQQTSVDQVVATDLAANLAETTNLPVASNVANLSVSLESSSQLTQSDSSSAVISKPQIIQPTANSRAIITYVTKAGDTATTVGAAYGISAQTVEWANNLTSNAIAVGKSLVILPVDGVLYTVKAGDTIQSIATIYKVDPTELTTYNDLDLGGLTSGSQIVLPGGILPDTQRPGYVAPVSYSSYIADYTASAGNKYAYGYCTWYAYNRRAEMGMPIGSYWGNASNWAYAAAAAGFVVNHTPSYGAIMQNGGGAGHVAVVESVDANGNVTVSEMNNSEFGGWGHKDVRTISAGQAAVYTFIH
jgi:surface antigen